MGYIFWLSSVIEFRLLLTHYIGEAGWTYASAFQFKIYWHESRPSDTGFVSCAGRDLQTVNPISCAVNCSLSRITLVGIYL